MRIDGANTVNFETQTESNPVNGQVHPARTTSSLAAAEFAEIANIANESMEEALEDLSLGFSNYLKRLNSKERKDEARLGALEELIEQMEGEQADGIRITAGQLARLGDADSIMTNIGQMNMDTGNVMLMLANVIAQAGLSEEIKNKLRKKLQEMLAEEGAELALIAAMEGLPLDQAGLESLKGLYQRAARGDGGLARWFGLLRDMPDRRKRIRVLLRALSGSLNEENTGTDMVKLITVIDDLRRLLLFMSVEDYCKALSRACQIDDSAVLDATLELVEQSWVYAEWLEEKIQKMKVSELKQIGFLRRWRDLMLQLPTKCYRDPEQKEHITDAMMDLLDRWCEEE